MSRTSAGKLDIFGLAALLVGAHYGLGFILGTGEEALTQGMGASLYAISIGIGMIVLALLSKFYWTEEEPIWILLGNRYGDLVKILVRIVSWCWAIGTLAVQILGGAFILKSFGISLPISMTTMVAIFVTIALLSVERVGRLFKGILVINSLVLFYCLWQLNGLSTYWHAPLDFIPALKEMPLTYQLGIFFTKVLSIPIDIRLQIFTVQAKNPKIAYYGCILSGVILIFLAFVPSVVAIAANNSGILPPNLPAKQTIPFIFSWLGGGMHQALGIFFILCLLLSALGSGSSLVRGLNQIIFELNLLPVNNLNFLVLAIINGGLGLGVAFLGGSLIDLMVSFYALYVAAILVPFIAYFLAAKGIAIFSPIAVKLSAIFGSGAGIIALITTFFLPGTFFSNSQQLSILTVGIGFSLAGLFGGQVIENFSAIERKKIKG